jgi:hypothetical protein
MNMTPGWGSGGFGGWDPGAAFAGRIATGVYLFFYKNFI